MTHRLENDLMIQIQSESQMNVQVVGLVQSGRDQEVHVLQEAC